MDKALEDYLVSIEIPMEEIASASASNIFADENLIAQGSYAKVYKGQLLLEPSGETMDIVIRKLLQLNYNLAFNEIKMSKDLKHKNILSLFRIVENETDDEELLYVNKHQVNESLDKHLSGSTLTWMQRLQICVGVAYALRYLHYDLEDNCSVIHGNIKSSKILLDQDWEPKLHDFRCAIKGRRHELYLTSKYNGSLEYMDPAFEHTGGLTHKSDVFSFGVVLFEVLFGRKACVADNDNWYFARLARRCYDEKTLDDMIDPNLRNQMDHESLNIFSKTAYYCLIEQRSKRPNMEQIVRQLESALEHQRKHQSLVHPRAAIEGTSSSRLKVGNIDHLRIQLKDIELATNNFSQSFRIGSGGYGTVYKAELNHFDEMNPSAIEGKNKSELPKRSSTVAIKHISSRVDGEGEQGFLVEIELLRKCKHPNIVSLLGFCDEGSKMILVYEYASKGSLESYLENIDNMTYLTWDQRLQICLDIAHGLEYLHTSRHDKETIIHRDIKSANILLDDNWVAKIADFGLSKSHHVDEPGSTLVTNHVAGTEVYLDPEYRKTGKLKKASDIYSLGVVLFEIVCGRLAYDETFNGMGLPFVAQQCFKNDTLKDLVDPKLKEAGENDIHILNAGVNQKSLDTFSSVAYQCLAESQSDRPKIGAIISELKKAIKLNKEDLYISLEDIKLATENLSNEKCIGEGRWWKQYKGDLSNANNGYAAVIAKRFDSESPEVRHQFLTELKILFKSKHENIVSLMGYCIEMDERIVVYEHALNGRLDEHLNNPSLTWTKRLKICIDVACGLEFLHTGGAGGIEMIHRNMKTSNILLDAEWNAKISNLELSTQASEFKIIELVTDDNAYVCPEHIKAGFLTKKSDIYSLGVILAEIICGRPLAVGEINDWDDDLNVEYDLNQDGESFKKISSIVERCLEEEVEDRPEATVVVRKLKKALELQEDQDIWEPRLPIDYEEIIEASKDYEAYEHIKMKRELYDKFCDGILLEDGKVLFSLGSNGARNEMISATKFSYKNPGSHMWRSVQESRFQEVEKMSDLSKLKIEIKITTQYLSPNVNYGVYLIFKFCDAIKFSSKPMYINLNYKMGGENMHAYFATWRDKEWMKIELCRFLSHKKDTDFEVVLESLSRYYCENDDIYVEGIEFRVIDDVKHDEICDKEEMKPLPSEHDEIFEKLSPNEVNEKKHFMLSAMQVLHDSSNMKRIAESRFQEVIELPPQQVFRTSSKFQSQMLSRDTEYLCYLVFKLSEECQELHCPVKVGGKVRDLLHTNDKETKIVYFGSPSAWNLHDITSVPRQREDGWMEVKVWNFVSNHDLHNNSTRVNLEFSTYEGNMPGLIIGGLEFRPM